MRFLLVALCAAIFSFTAAAQTYEEKVVAAVLMGEAWGEGTHGMIAVAEVIAERVRAHKHAPLQIVTARKQFSVLNSTSPQALVRKYEKEKDFAVALKIARTACREPAKLPGLTKGANHYHEESVDPKWARGKQPLLVIGKHKFYRL